MQHCAPPGYAIVQCADNTVFIPAGAAHLVRNLHHCIKVAKDIVWPQNSNCCLHLSQEFRHLTECHTKYQDKIQIKSILLHSFRNIVSVLKN